MKAEQIIDFFNKLTGIEPKFSGGENVYVNCPLAKWTHRKGTDSRPSMSVKVRDDGYSPVFCWNPHCKFRGNLKQLVYELFNYDSSIFVDYFVDLFHTYEKYEYSAFIDNFDLNFDNVFEGLHNDTYDKSLLSKYTKIEKPWRDLSIDTVNKFDLHYDDYEKRILFPVYSTSGELVGCSGRTTNDHRIKYKNYWNFKKSKYLYGEHLVRNDSCILVEGQYDTMKIHDTCKHMDCDVLGMFGARLSDVQAKKILTWHRRCLIFTDNDDAGRIASEQIIRSLINELDEIFIVCYRTLKKDPGELTKEELLEHINNSIRVRNVLGY